MYVLGPMGSGKTLFTTLYTKVYSNDNKDNKIYSNYMIDLPNSVYTPFMFLPFSEMKDCIIIADDFYALQNVKTFIQIISNMSRKRNITIVLTAQYYTMIPKVIRTLSDFEVKCQYDKENDILYSMLVDGNNNLLHLKYESAVQIAKSIYNTNEIVEFPTERKLLIEIKKYSKNIDDLELNLMLYTSNTSKRKSLFNSLKKELKL